MSDYQVKEIVRQVGGWLLLVGLAGLGTLALRAIWFSFSPIAAVFLAMMVVGGLLLTLFDW